LTATYPPELVDEVLAATGRMERRRRLLPARVIVGYAS
jgi:Insertion element 4 transposase N-terminal